MNVATMEKDDSSKSSQRKKLLEEPLTRKDVEIAVNRALGEEAQLNDYHVRMYSEEKLGFLGCHRHLLVSVRDSEDGKLSRHTFFLKSMPYEVEEQALVIDECRAFVKETNFYREILPRLVASVKDKSWVPECYLVKEDALLFEDLKSRGFRLADKFLQLPELKAGLSALARLHASTILTESRLGRAFSKMLRPELLAESLFCRSGPWSQWYSTSVDLLVKLMQQLGFEAVPVASICERVFEKLSASSRHRNVICHGDVKSYNMMFDHSQPIPNCVLVDFQLLRYVPASADLLQFLYLATRREFRMKHEKQLLRHYHEVFSATLRENNESIRGASLDELLQEYEQMRVVGLVTAGMYFPIMLLDGKKCAEMTSNSGGFTNLLFRDRFQLVLDTMKADPDYNQIMREVLDEFIQRSDQLLAL